jgi:hypothetical protein
VTWRVTGTWAHGLAKADRRSHRPAIGRQTQQALDAQSATVHQYRTDNDQQPGKEKRKRHYDRKERAELL